MTIDDWAWPNRQSQSQIAIHAIVNVPMPQSPIEWRNPQSLNRQ